MKKLHILKDIFFGLYEEKPTVTRACIFGIIGVILYYAGVLAVHLLDLPEKALTTGGLFLFWCGLLWVCAPFLTECARLVHFVFAYIREYYLRGEE
jgi:hypothetical protein